MINIHNLWTLDNRLYNMLHNNVERFRSEREPLELAML